MTASMDSQGRSRGRYVNVTAHDWAEWRELKRGGTRPRAARTVIGPLCWQYCQTKGDYSSVEWRDQCEALVCHCPCHCPVVWRHA